MGAGLPLLELRVVVALGARGKSLCEHTAPVSLSLAGLGFAEVCICIFILFKNLHIHNHMVC